MPITRRRAFALGVAGTALVGAAGLFGGRVYVRSRDAGPGAVRLAISIDDLLARLRDEGPMVFRPSGMALVHVPPDEMRHVEQRYDESCLAGMRRGLLALQIGAPGDCTLVRCTSNGWWQACDGTQYTALGESVRSGERGTGRWPVEFVSGGAGVVVRTDHRPVAGIVRTSRHDLPGAGGPRCA